MKMYKYRPVRFYLLAVGITWFFWIVAIMLHSEIGGIVGMVIGLSTPAVISAIMIASSKNKELKRDFKEKLFSIKKLNVGNLLLVIVLSIAAVCISILLSTLFGQSLSQFSFTEDFSFTGIGLASALLTILLASGIEELGWHNYGVDSIALYHSWFKTSLIFSFIWAAWHLPLFWIPGSYQCGLRESNIWFMVNFIISIIPLAFLINWVYIKNDRSILACIIFHLFINFMQEKVAMTAITKCVETGVMLILAIIIVIADKKTFFSKLENTISDTPQR